MDRLFKGRCPHLAAWVLTDDPDIAFLEVPCSTCPTPVHLFPDDPPRNGAPA